jgi:hypothetical protein
VYSVQSPEQLCDEEPIYKLAWNLDAAITQRKLTVKHMRQLAEALKQHLEVRLAAVVALTAAAAAAAACTGSSSAEALASAGWLVGWLHRRVGAKHCCC